MKQIDRLLKHFLQYLNQLRGNTNKMLIRYKQMRDTVSPSDNSCGSCTVLIVNESDKQLKMFHYYI